MTLTASGGASYLWSRAGQTTVSRSRSMRLGPTAWWGRMATGAARLSASTKCDGQPVADGGDRYAGGPTTLLRRRERDADGQCRARVICGAWAGRRRSTITVNASWELHRGGDGCERVQRDEREHESVTVNPLPRWRRLRPAGRRRFCAGREVTLTASGWEQLVCGAAGGDEAIDHGQCERGLQRGGDGCERVQRDEPEH